MISVAIHRNLSRLIGFCTTPTERLLVYPFMQNLHTYHYNSKTHSCSSSILKAHLSRLMLVWDLESRHLVSTLLHLPPYSNSQVPSSNSLISKLCYLLVQKMLMLAMSKLRTSGICSYFWSWKESHEWGWFESFICNGHICRSIWLFDRAFPSAKRYRSSSWATFTI